MQLVRNPNSWSCLLASVAMVLEMTIEELIEEVGHDGSEIVCPDLKSPGNRKAFHIQEFISIILEKGFAITDVAIRPVSTPDGKCEYEIKFPDSMKRFRRLMAGVKGIIVGKNREWYHAVAWDGKIIYDPAGHIYSFDEMTMDILTFYRFDQIKSVEN